MLWCLLLALVGCGDGDRTSDCDDTIMCNDGTCSPSCTSCDQGCCSSHEGC